MSWKAELEKRKQELIEEEKNKSLDQKRSSPKRTSSKGLQDHIFNKKNLLSFFFRKKGNRAKKYELYSFFYNSKDINLNNKIDEQINKWHKQGILKRNQNNWYYPNSGKQDEIEKILEVS